MILQILGDTRQVVHHAAPLLPQQLVWPNPGQLQEPRRVDLTSANSTSRRARARRITLSWLKATPTARFPSVTSRCASARTSTFRFGGFSTGYS
jgi:hypothetical protein